MGNIPGLGGPLNEAKQQEIRECVEKVLETFTKEYLKLYVVTLLEKIEEEVKETSEEWQLLERPEGSSPTEPLKEGYLVKQGVLRKSWKRRYFVVLPDYRVEYYESEETYQKQKAPKGTIVPCGYSVQNEPIKNRLEELAETAQKIGAVVSELPKPDTLPDHCFELHHKRRRCYFIKAENDEEKAEWVKVFKRCTRMCRGFLTEDEVHNTAFIGAVSACRSALHHWGWWTFGGSEAQILGDLIIHEIDTTVLASVYNDIKGPVSVRVVVRNQILKTLDTTVSGAIAPALIAMKTAVKAIRGRVEPVIRDKMALVHDTKETVQDKIRDACLAQILPVLESKVSPHLTPILEILFSPMYDAFSETRAVFDNAMDEMFQKVEKDDGFGPSLNIHFKRLDRLPRGWYALRKAHKKADSMELPLWGLANFFEDVEPYELIKEAHNTMGTVLDNAVYTFENDLTEETEGSSGQLSRDDAKKAVVKCRESVTEKFQVDSHKATVDFFKSIMVTMCMPTVMKAVGPVCEPLLEPIASAVPEELSEILDVEKMFEETVQKIVQGLVDGVVDPACESHLGHGANGTSGANGHATVAVQ